MFPLQIYTALKPFVNSKAGHPVCFPYKFTLLSNGSVGIKTVVFVCFPYKFTLLSNPLDEKISGCWFVSPTNLHCSQTDYFDTFEELKFVSPTNLHCSQTSMDGSSIRSKFVSPTNLHCSQTSNHSRKISAKYLRNIHSLLETLLF